VIVGAAALLEQLAEGVVIVGVGDLADGVAYGSGAAEAIVKIVGGVGSVVFTDQVVAVGVVDLLRAVVFEEDLGVVAVAVDQVVGGNAVAGFLAANAGRVVDETGGGATVLHADWLPNMPVRLILPGK